MIKRIIRDRAGGIPVIFIGLVFFLLLICFLIMEMGAAYENHYAAETILQRSCNSAVEKNMLDAYRADGILCLDAAGAISDFYRYIESDMPDKYTVTVSSITGSATPPVLTATGTVTFSTLFGQYGFDDLAFDFAVQSTNYRTEPQP
jgi:Flp pilus assembly protein TadG